MREHSMEDWGWPQPTADRQMEGYSSFGQYMHIKERKLALQQNTNLQSEIFKDIVIYINGWTDPDADTLRSLITENGGRWVQYDHPRAGVTHVIAMQLASGKKKRFLAQRKMVVKPAWIVESVKAGKLLDPSMYLLYRESARLDNLFSVLDSSFTSTAEVDVELESLPDSNGLESNNDSEVESNTTSNSEGDMDYDVVDYLATNMDDCDDTLSDRDTTTSDNTDDMLPEDSIQDSTLIAETEIIGHDVDRNIDINSPDFIEKYYARSRLHHLSRWREELKIFASTMAPLPRNIQKHTDLLKDESIHFMHIDMDCFFVSVSRQRFRPDLIDDSNVPMGVAHAVSDKDIDRIRDSGSDLASCNYAARNFGIRNGMYVRQAVEKCPTIIILPYDFDAYHQVALKLYRLLAQTAIAHQHPSIGPILIPISCDEAYIAVHISLDDISKQQVLHLADDIRNDVFAATGCSASIGIGSSPLLARLATRKAKPNNRFLVTKDNCNDFISNQTLSSLPGVGWSTINSLKESFSDLTLETCGQLQTLSVEQLQSCLGVKSGLNLYNSCRGIDHPIRMIERYAAQPKSLGCDITWAVRFTNQTQVQCFIQRLSLEIWKRLQNCLALTTNQSTDLHSGQDISLTTSASYTQQDSAHSKNYLRFVEQKSTDLVSARKLTVKVMQQQENAPAPVKHLGHGFCDSFSKSKSNLKIDNSTVLANQAMALIESLKIQPERLRGIGIFISDFVFANTARRTVSIKAQLMAQSKSSIACETVASPTLRLKSSNSSLDCDIQSLDTANRTASAQNKRPVDQIQDASIEMLLQQNGVDLDVFQSLPQHIQDLILADACRPVERSNTVSTTRTKSSTSATNQASIDSFFKPIHGSRTTIRQATQKAIQKSVPKTKLISKPLVIPEDVDPSCFAALPVDLQQELAEDWQRKRNVQLMQAALCHEAPQITSVSNSTTIKDHEKLSESSPLTTDIKQLSSTEEMIQELKRMSEMPPQESCGMVALASQLASRIANSFAPAPPDHQVMATVHQYLLKICRNR